LERRKKQGKPFTLMAANSIAHRKAGAGKAADRIGKGPGSKAGKEQLP